jgi:hypothetical protein
VSRARLDEEQPPAEWLDAESERRREAFERERAQLRQDRLAERRGLPRHERLRQLEVRLALTSTVSAATTGDPITSGAPGTKPPPTAITAPGAAAPAEVEKLLTLITAAIAKLEALSEGSAGMRPMDSVEADAALRGYRGMSPEDVAALDDRMGSPEAVRRARRRLGLRARDGAEVKPAPVHAV